MYNTLQTKTLLTKQAWKRYLCFTTTTTRQRNKVKKIFVHPHKNYRSRSKLRHSNDLQLVSDGQSNPIYEGSHVGLEMNMFIALDKVF